MSQVFHCDRCDAVMKPYQVQQLAVTSERKADLHADLCERCVDHLLEFLGALKRGSADSIRSAPKSLEATE